MNKTAAITRMIMSAPVLKLSCHQRSDARAGSMNYFERLPRLGAAHTRSAHRLSRRYHTSLSANPGYAAFRPLGFGTTNTAASPMRSGFGPAPGLAEGPK